jgi:hypothetical protein
MKYDEIIFGMWKWSGYVRGHPGTESHLPAANSTARCHCSNVDSKCACPSAKNKFSIVSFPNLPTQIWVST